jgi:translocation and assembly module TamB
MEPAKRRKLPLWTRFILGVVVALLVLAVTAVGLRYWITSDGGRAFIASQIDGRRIGPLGTLRIQGGLTGDPLQAASLADIALVDDDGVWLRAKDVRVEWTPEKLFSGELEIHAIHVRLVDVLRVPRTTYESQRNPPPDIGLKLDEVIIEELKLAETIFKSDATYRISGGLARPRDGSGFARLNLQPLTGPGDIVDASAEWSAEGALSGKAMAVGPAGGLIASFIQPPEGVHVALSANLDGTLTNLTADAKLLFNDDTVVSLDVSREGDAASLTATLDAGLWPMLAPLNRRAGGPMTLTGNAGLADIKRAPLSLTLNAPAGRLDFSTVGNLEAVEFPEPAILSAQGLDLGLVAAPVTGKADARGEIRLIGLTDFEWKGDVTGTNITWPSGAASKVTGPLTIAKDGPSIYWETSDAIVDGGRVSSLKQLAPARYTVATRGDVNLRTRLVEINQAQVQGVPGEATGRGSYTIGTGAFNFAGAASFARLSDLAPLTGSARGQWTVTRSSDEAPIRITADATGRQVSSRIAALAQLAGSQPNAQIAGVVRDGHFSLESGRFQGAGVNATMTGRIADSGVITARATGALSRPLKLPGATIRTLAFAANVRGQIAAPRVDLDVSNGALDVAGLKVERVAGEAQATLGDKLAGDFTLSGGSEDQLLAVAGRLQGANGGYGISNLNARLGGVQLTAPLLSYDDGVFSAAFDANGSLQGFGGLDRGTVAARGKVTLGEEMTLDVSGQLANLRRGPLRIELLSFDADAANDSATLKGRIKGTTGAPMDIAYNAAGDRSDDVWTGTATLEGSVDQQPISTARPANWSYGAGAWMMDAELAAFGGTMDADVSSSAEAASASFDVVNLDLRVLSRLARITPINGRVTGKSTFRNGAEPATADMQIAITNANPVGVTADPVNVNLTGRLREGQLTTIATGSGQGFKLEAGSQLRMLGGEGFNIAPDRTAPLEARLTLKGRAEQMWALFGPEGQALRGQLDADVRAAGTLARPVLTGGFSMADGAYEHGETGLRLVGIAATGAFDQRSARITELSANDTQGGRLTGEGVIDWEDGVDGSIRFSAANLRALGRDDRSAVLSGDGAVTLDEEAIRVSGEFDVSQARISVEQPASASIPTLPIVRRVNFPNQELETENGETPAWRKPIQLNLHIKAPRRVVVYGRGLDTEWSADFRIEGSIANPTVKGTATLVRGDLALAGRRFEFDTGSINLDGPLRTARIDISAQRTAEDIDARVHVTGSPSDPKFSLESTPSLPQDEILARVLFGRSASELSAFEAAQLAAGLAQLAGGQAGFDPVGLVRQATGLDRVAIGASGGIATVSAGKYVADDVYLQVGAGGEGGIGAEVEWEPRENLSIISSAQGNGDTKIAVRWKRDY